MARQDSASSAEGLALTGDESSVPPSFVRVREIFTNNCVSCHAQGTELEAYPYLDKIADSTIEGFVTPGKAEDSNLYQAITQRVSDTINYMPKGKKKLSDGDIAAVKSWIDAGSPIAATSNVRAATQSTFISDGTATLCMLHDLSRVTSTKQQFTRYLTFTHLYNAGANAEQMNLAREALSKTINSLSYGPDIVRPIPIDPAQTIFRIDLSDYFWTNTKAWDLLTTGYPYNFRPTNSKGEQLSQLMGHSGSGVFVPAMRADWVINVGVKAGIRNKSGKFVEVGFYHEILGIPDTEKKLEQKLGVDVESNLKNLNAVRGGFPGGKDRVNGSRVSSQNRLIERHSAPSGAYWKSYDFLANSEKANLFKHPLGPAPIFDKSISFEHDGGEIIFNLPNGFQAYMLSDGKGNRIDKGPLEVVSDPSRPDRAVHNGISCIGCHVYGMIPKKDMVFPAVRQSPNNHTGTYHIIEGLYDSKEQERPSLEYWIERDTKRFVTAMEKAGVSVREPEQIRVMVERFEGNLSSKEAAAELGMKESTFLDLLRRSSAQGELSALFSGGSVARRTFNCQFSTLVKDFRLGIFVAPSQGLICDDSTVASGATAGSTGNSSAASVYTPTGSAKGLPVGMSFVSFDGFEMQETELTRGQWYEVLGQYPVQINSCEPTTPTGDDHPVSCVSYNDIVDLFLPAMKKRMAGDGFTYRLSNEHEWFKAAGNIGEEYGRCLHNSKWRTHPVKSRGSSNGLYDMVGNVEEWTSSSAADWTTSSIDSGSYRVSRGGNWGSDAQYCRSSLSSAWEPGHRSSGLGFRLLRARP